MSVADLEEEVLRLRRVLQSKEDELLKLKEKEINKALTQESSTPDVPKWAVERYSRQSLVTELGAPLHTLRALGEARVLVVGAGGLGCPSAGYLAGAGVGHIGIVDYDDVEVTNIHRQLLHSELTVGMSKVESAAIALRRINSTIKITPFNAQLDSSNALDIIREFDVVVDATDNVVTRYLLNDSCVILGKPLVSASALKMEGQLTVYNYRPKDSKLSPGPCMRCLFPLPPPPDAVGSCSQNGVLGPVPGTMGALQALEVLKLLVGQPPLAGYMLLMDGADCSFRRVKLRGQSPSCAVCSDNPTITQLIDYPRFCNAQASDKDLKLKILPTEDRIQAKDFNKNIYSNLFTGDKKISETNITESGVNSCNSLFVNFSGNTLFLDVRSEGEFQMCHVKGSRNLPIDRLECKSEELARFVKENGVNKVFFICRRGNDSQVAAKQLKIKLRELYPSEPWAAVMDVAGGLHAWAKDVDDTFPIY